MTVRYTCLIDEAVLLCATTLWPRPHRQRTAEYLLLTKLYPAPPWLQVWQQVKRELHV